MQSITIRTRQGRISTPMLFFRRRMAAIRVDPRSIHGLYASLTFIIDFFLLFFQCFVANSNKKVDVTYVSNKKANVKAAARRVSEHSPSFQSFFQCFRSPRCPSKELVYDNASDEETSRSSSVAYNVRSNATRSKVSQLKSGGPGMSRMSWHRCEGQACPGWSWHRCEGQGAN